MARNATVPGAALLLVLACNGAFAADDLCVSCAGPAATYRCQVDPAAGLTQGAADPRAQLLCITELAKLGKHETCAVDRAASTACSGPVRIVAPVTPYPADPGTAAGAAPPMRPAVQGAAAANEQAAINPPSVDGAAKPTDDAPPKTVEELVKKSSLPPPTGLQEAGKTIAKTADSAGAAVTDTAKAAGEAVTGTAKTAGDAVGKAGSAVGGVAKKSWDCVTSLFSKC